MEGEGRKGVEMRAGREVRRERGKMGEEERQANQASTLEALR